MNGSQVRGGGHTYIPPTHSGFAYAAVGYARRAVQRRRAYLHTPYSLTIRVWCPVGYAWVRGGGYTYIPPTLRVNPGCRSTPRPPSRASATAPLGRARIYIYLRIQTYRSISFSITIHLCMPYLATAPLGPDRRRELARVRRHSQVARRSIQRHTKRASPRPHPQSRHPG